MTSFKRVALPLQASFRNFSIPSAATLCKHLGLSGACSAVSLSGLHRSCNSSLLQLAVEGQQPNGVVSGCFQPNAKTLSFSTTWGLHQKSLFCSLPGNMRISGVPCETSVPAGRQPLPITDAIHLFSDRKRKILNGTEYIRRKTGYRGRIRRGRQAPC